VRDGRKAQGKHANLRKAKQEIGCGVRCHTPRPNSHGITSGLEFFGCGCLLGIGPHTDSTPPCHAETSWPHLPYDGIFEFSPRFGQFFGYFG
jgi:hypothetical protein